MLQNLAVDQLPQFGVDPSSIRRVVLNSTSIASTVLYSSNVSSVNNASTTTNSTEGNVTTGNVTAGTVFNTAGMTVYLIHIQFTAIIVRSLHRMEFALVTGLCYD